MIIAMIAVRMMLLSIQVFEGHLGTRQGLSDIGVSIGRTHQNANKACPPGLESYVTSSPSLNPGMPDR